MTYENFQNLGSEDKNQEPGKGERTADTAFSMSSRVHSLCVHPGWSCVLESAGCWTQHREPVVKRIQEPQEDGGRGRPQGLAFLCSVGGPEVCSAGSWGWRAAHLFQSADMCEPVRNLPAPICVLPESPPPALITRLYHVLVSNWVLNTSSES